MKLFTMLRVPRTLGGRTMKIATDPLKFWLKELPMNLSGQYQSIEDMGLPRERKIYKNVIFRRCFKQSTDPLT
ncbi:hypothetical protein CS022_06005 [Veronia nyctiphanis]|uniref:Uncharacterized protein n=1 Tax=Veronia nyctiphanis TaxID=1278244 RepID=A0A4Q0YSE9_9GAMM|nr:hypothetical protein CS022_06005 [Veronia nyctiphanis]